MKVLLFFNLSDAEAACDMINANMRAKAVAAGYTLDENGNVIGKDAAGNDQPGAQPTTCWDTPHEVGEGTTIPPGSYTHWINDPRPRLGDDALNGVEGYDEGDYAYPVDPDEV